MTDPLVVADAVRDALAAGVGVVALETSVIGQGLPAPRNEECVRRMSSAIRESGGLPAWIGVVDGRVIVGLGADELARFCEPGVATKVARRDLPVAVAARDLGATTVSATIWTGSKAGVLRRCDRRHRRRASRRGARCQRRPARARTHAGAARLLRPEVDHRSRRDGREARGARCGDRRLRGGSAAVLPGEGGTCRAGTPRRLARRGGRRCSTLRSPWAPGPPCWSATRCRRRSRWTPTRWRGRLVEAERLADEHGVSGKARTPFLLSTLAELTGGRSLEANLALLEDNARVAAEIAVARARRS